MRRLVKKPAAGKATAVRKAIKKPAAAKAVRKQIASNKAKAPRCLMYRFPYLHGTSSPFLALTTFKWGDEEVTDEKVNIFDSRSAAKPTGSLPIRTIVLDLAISGFRGWSCDIELEDFDRRSLLLIPGQRATIKQAKAVVAKVARSKPKAQWPLDTELFRKVQARLKQLGWRAHWAESTDKQQGGGKGHAPICNGRPVINAFNLMFGLKKGLRPITAAEDALKVWSKQRLRFAPRDEVIRAGTSDVSAQRPSPPAGCLARFLTERSDAHVVPEAYAMRLRKQGLTFDFEGSPPHERWHSTLGHFTVRQLRYLLMLRYEHIDLYKLSCFGEHRYLEGFEVVRKHRGEPVFAPGFGS